MIAVDDETAAGDTAANNAGSLTLLAAVAAQSGGQMGSENFPVALRMLPRQVQAELAAVYRFARFVDDVGDETPVGADERLALLDLIATDVRRLGRGAPMLTPVADLTAATTRHAIPVQTYLDLVEANRRDQRPPHYETFDDLLGYCRLSAAPVGRIVLHVAGAASEENIAASDAVCAALQVLEHCQDIGEDARRGRVYLPGADLRAHGIGVDGELRDDRALRAAGTSPALRAVIATQVERSRGLLAEGRPLVRRLRGWARVAVAGYVAGGLATADALDAAAFEVLANQVTPSKARTVRAAAAVWAGRS